MINKLPTNWTETHLSSIAHIEMGQSPDSATYNFEKKGLPFFQGKTEFGEKYPTPVKWCSSPSKIAQKDDILLSVRAPVGPTNLAKEISCIGRGLSAIRGYEGVETLYLYYYFKSIEDWLSQQGTGTTFKAINSEVIRNLTVNLAPTNEQIKIVEKIEELFSELDNGIEELKTAQKKLELYRQSLLKSAVEGELSKEWREIKTDVSETGEQLLARILKERRERWEQDKLKEFAEKGKNPPKDWKEKYPEPVQPDIENLPQLPEGWIWASLDMLLENIKAGKSFRCEERPPKEDEIGVVKVSAVSWGEYNELESKTCIDATKINPDYYIKENDFLMSRANTIQLVGACVISRDVTLTNMLSDKILRLDFILDSLIFKNWFLHIMRSKIGRQQIEESATGNQESMKNISQDSIKKISVPLPPTDEIKFLIKELSEKFNAIKETSNLLAMNFDNLVQQRKNILKDAFTGKLVAQNQSDEPASILLEHIQAEREIEAAKLKKNPRKKAQKSDLEIIVPKADEDKLKVVMDAISSFGNQTFSAQDLSKKCMLNYEDFSDILFNLLSEEKSVLKQLFDINIKAMRLKKI
ncbi:restriction endonuclease subunit S [Acinetobacter baumannii]|uniref:restriction endonuclease subunit S n=2 Tax=Acinetobacter baumannii TaxID=470 RepID=UPI000BF8DF67|nr:restriction endonuclease subunit S [Acinetobacter baumannii]MCZ3062275.1 restriction endonuclease subunit S [Acinetobacter baumannii]MDC4518733.1 restriction endonuclease subunit S [Acinetobacter baumannii]MDC4579421.1 restriction endonuclease subunit S [Acinetobacter baumannii]MDC4662552.1 restriction endonuclease subunit S [Acinetobacter baumannii]MDC4676453.1 restriction endonuclease subunit S [Acinetobacter baumannii]